MIQKVGMFGLGIAVGIALLAVWFLLTPDPATEVVVPSDESTSTPAHDVVGTTPDSALQQQANESATEETGIVVMSQPAGDTVEVTSAIFTADGWLVVHEEILDGIIGNALGAARRDAGTYNSITIELLRPTEPGKHYWIALYADNGDRIFTLADDVPLYTPEGELLLTGFTAQ